MSTHQVSLMEKCYKMTLYVQHEIERTFDRYWKSTESKMDLIAALPIDLVLALFFKRQGKAKSYCYSFAMPSNESYIDVGDKWMLVTFCLVTGFRYL